MGELWGELCGGAVSMGTAIWAAVCVCGSCVGGTVGAVAQLYGELCGGDVCKELYMGEAVFHLCLVSAPIHGNFQYVTLWHVPVDVLPRLNL